jgi:hypothetical protein
MISEPLKKSKQRSTVKTASSLKETREQEAFNVSEEHKDHKIWVDIQVEQNRLLQAMIDSEAINNYILQQAIEC